MADFNMGALVAALQELQTPAQRKAQARARLGLGEADATLTRSAAQRAKKNAQKHAHAQVQGSQPSFTCCHESCYRAFLTRSALRRHLRSKPAHFVKLQAVKAAFILADNALDDLLESMMNGTEVVEADEVEQAEEAYKDAELRLTILEQIRFK